MEGPKKNPRRDTVHRQVWGVKDRSKTNYRREKLALRKKVNEDEHLGTYVGSRRRDRNGSLSARPNGLGWTKRKRLNCVFVSETWTCQKKERGIPAVGGRRKKAHRAALAATHTTVEHT